MVQLLEFLDILDLCTPDCFGYTTYTAYVEYVGYNIRAGNDGHVGYTE